MKIIKKRTILLIALCISLGFYLSYNFFIKPTKAKETWVVPNVQNTNKKFISRETLINQIQKKQELITLEIEMTEKISIDDSWGNLPVFKKIQNIDFSGNGIYTIDLSSLNNDNIDINTKSKKVTVKVPSPVVKDVSINEDKTKYEDPQKGLFRFGELKMSPAEFQVIRSNVREKMITKMGEQDLYKQALSTSSDTVKKLLDGIIQGETQEKYDIDVQFNNSSK
jgi:hypothetical protein